MSEFDVKITATSARTSYFGYMYDIKEKPDNGEYSFLGADCRTGFVFGIADAKRLSAVRYENMQETKEIEADDPVVQLLCGRNGVVVIGKTKAWAVSADGTIIK